MCRSAYNIVKDELVAEDIVQDIFLKLYQSDKEMEIEYPKSFFKRSATNAAIDYYRKKSKTNFVNIDDQFNVSSEEEEEKDLTEVVEKVNAAIDLLPPKCRTIFILKRKENYTNKEIAEKLDISVKTVENQMTKAFKFLRSHLGPIVYSLLILGYIC